MNDISKTLKQMRIARGLSQKDMAERLGISYQSYNRWENDTGNLTMNRVGEIASVLGVEPISILLGYELKSMQ